MKDPRERVESQEKLVHQENQAPQEALEMLVVQDSRAALDCQETTENQ